MAKKKGMAYGAFGLEFIGSIFFLVTAAFLLPVGYGFSSEICAWNGSL